MLGKVEDKQENPIEVGDTVFTKISGGKREGEVTFPVHYKLGLR
jgi:predicted HAD superfamily phosphohydrolase YqeG